MKPFFKWSGGKRREIKRVRKYMPASYNTYYEPFVGGGAVWLDLEPTSAVVGDSYEDLVNFFQTLKTQPDRLVTEINSLSNKYAAAHKNLPKKPELEKEIELLKATVKKLKNDEGASELYKEKKQTLTRLNKDLKKEFQEIAEEFYYSFRDGEPKSDLDRALRFYILRQLSFSGMLRFGSKGNFNVPFGWYSSLKSIDVEIEEINRVLNNTRIVNCDWRECVKTATEHDFVFLDPPYTRKFTKYHPNGEFSQKEHLELAEWFSTTSTNAMIIINKDDFTNGLYSNFIKEEYGHKYSIQYRDRMKEKDSNAVHILATNYNFEKVE